MFLRTILVCFIFVIDTLTLILGAVKADNGAVVNHVFCGSMMGINTAANKDKTVCSK